MSTMNTSQFEALKNFVDTPVTGSASSEHVRELIRCDQDRRQLRGLLLDGAASALTAPVDRVYFDELRVRARRHEAA